MKKILLLLLISSCIFAEVSFNLNLDNDGGFSDEFYSNGIELEVENRRDGYFTEDGKEAIGNEEFYYQYVDRYSFGQKIYTPSNLKLGPEDSDEYERPYMGYLYVGYTKERYSNQGSIYNHSYYIGLSGEESLAHFYQREYHKLIGSPIPMGWSTQIDEGILVQYRLEYSPNNHILYQEGDDRLDLRYGTRIDIGTLQLRGDINLLMRYGRIASDFESKKARFGRVMDKGLWGMEEYYFYGRTIARLIIHDTTYEGGIHDNSSPYTVEINPFVLEQNIGFVLQWERFGLEYKFNMLSSEVDDEEWSISSHLYNSLNFKYFY